MKSRFLNEWIFIKCFGEDSFTKYKILKTFKEMGSKFYSVQTEGGEVFNIPCDAVQVIGETKKAKVIPFKRKIKLVK